MSAEAVRVDQLQPGERFHTRTGDWTFVGVESEELAWAICHDPKGGRGSYSLHGKRDRFHPRVRVRRGWRADVEGASP